METNNDNHDVVDSLPHQFDNIPPEFRSLQKKFDKQNIFTNASNEVRLESRLRSHQFKEERQSGLIKGKDSCDINRFAKF